MTSFTKGCAKHKGWHETIQWNFTEEADARPFTEETENKELENQNAIPIDKRWYNELENRKPTHIDPASRILSTYEELHVASTADANKRTRKH